MNNRLRRDEQNNPPSAPCGAGTGRSSLCWLLGQPSDSITAITARKHGDSYGHDPLSSLVKSSSRSHHNNNSRQGPPVRVRLGNWQNTSLLPPSAEYDVVVLDYLLAAVEMHWAHHADEVITYPR